MNEQKNKILSIVIVAATALLGFEAISYTIRIYQLRPALHLSIYVYAFHIFWLAFVFDLHFKKRGVWAMLRPSHSGLHLFWAGLKERWAHLGQWAYLRHFLNYLVLPGILYWATVVLLFLNPFNHALKQSLIVAATFALSVAYWFMKEHVSRQLEHRASWIRVLAVVKLLAAGLAYAALLGVTFRYGFGGAFLLSSTMIVTFLLVYQALFQHRLLTWQTFLWVVAIALGLGVCAFWVFRYWNTQYFTGGLVMLAVYNTLWGLLHHYLDQTLTRRVVLDYLMMAVFVISVLLASHNFHQQII